MALKYPTLDSWLLVILHRLNAERDNWIIITGEEGEGKSTTVRKTFRRLNYLMRHWETAEVELIEGVRSALSDVWQPRFPLPRPFNLGSTPKPNAPEDSIRFGQDALLDLLADLEVAGIAIGDEIEGSKRLAMYADRLELLDHVKETRALRHTVGLCFPQYTDFEATMTKKRFAYWVHHPARGRIVVRERKGRGDNFDAKGEVYASTKWPVVGRYTIGEGNDPWKPRYEAKKVQRMRDRNARRREALDEEPSPMASPQQQLAWNPWVDLAQRELKA